MISVKNATELSKRETENFRKFYAKYFRRACVESNKNRTLSKINLVLKANRIAEEVVDHRILPGYSTSFVAFDEFENARTLIGFITGFATDAGMANLTDFFADTDDGKLRKLIAAKLYGAFAEAMKTEGMTKIQASGDIHDPILNDTLDSLHFDVDEVRGTRIDYARKL